MSFVVEKRSALTPRWTQLRPHPEQDALKTCSSRFIVVAAGRRSGKTERAKRRVVKEALAYCKPWPGKFIVAAPTREQAKRIFWNDVKDLVPKQFIAEVSESELFVTLVNGSRIFVVGMDRPERVEGDPIDGIVLDEYAAMRPEAWGRSVRPALSTAGREGWAMFIGKPKGRNHFWRLAEKAKSCEDGSWRFFTWKSADILSPEEIVMAKADLDPQTYAQEYDAEFVTFEGRAYYAFSRDEHARKRIRHLYDKRQPLSFALDFNVAPGVAAVIQEINHPDHGEVTGGIGQVWVPQNSNTRIVCRKLAADWGSHEGLVFLWGDATGGARGTAKVDGSDWDIAKEELRPIFGDRLRFRVPRRNPPERVRVNAVNTRFKTADGKLHAMIDPVTAPNLVVDLEGVSLIEGGSGEIDKHGDSSLTHISDAFGYYVVGKFPPVDYSLSSEEI